MMVPRPRILIKLSRYAIQSSLIWKTGNYRDGRLSGGNLDHMYSICHDCFKKENRSRTSCTILSDPTDENNVERLPEGWLPRRHLRGHSSPNGPRNEVVWVTCRQKKSGGKRAIQWDLVVSVIYAIAYSYKNRRTHTRGKIILFAGESVPLTAAISSLKCGLLLCASL